MPYRQQRQLPWEADHHAPTITNFGDQVFGALPQNLWRQIEPHFVKDVALRQHSSRLGALTAFLGHHAGQEDSGWLERLAEAAVLHDVGKTRLDPTILGKGRDVSSADLDHIRNHAPLGAALLEAHGGEPFGLAAIVARYHHEAHDGSGYPHGLIGDAVPQEARIVALCDVYDALRSPRSYKHAMEHDHAMRIILGGDNRTRPQQFDPYLLAVFERHSAAIAKLYHRN
jgi:HD-GYP domain-containing protein (c-di-GMP phosphodiesterase class II)